MEKEEADLVKSFYARKEKLLNNVKTLLKDSQKNPVVCAYDVFDGDYVPCQLGHYVVVLGENNTGILQSMIADLDIGLQVVTSLLGQLDMQAGFTMLGIGLTCTGIHSLKQKN